MATPLSQDLRRRLVRAVKRGSSAREAARRFDVSDSAAIKLSRAVKKARTTTTPSTIDSGLALRPAPKSSRKQSPTANTSKSKAYKTIALGRGQSRMASAASKLAPADTPSVNGDTSGLRKPA